MTTGSSMQAMTLTVPPHSLHVSQYVKVRIALHSCRLGFFAEWREWVVFCV